MLTTCQPFGAPRNAPQPGLLDPPQLSIPPSPLLALGANRFNTDRPRQPRATGFPLEEYKQVAQNALGSAVRVGVTLSPSSSSPGFLEASPK